MAHLTDKDALVTEIGRRIKFQQTCMKAGYRLTGKAEEEIILEYRQFLSFLDTIEVKEVDLDKEIDSAENRYHGFESLSRADIIDIAKYFFELGLKARQG